MPWLDVPSVHKKLQKTGEVGGKEEVTGLQKNYLQKVSSTESQVLKK